LGEPPHRGRYLLARQTLSGAGERQGDLATISPFDIEADLPMIRRVVYGRREQGGKQLKQLLGIGAHTGQIRRHRYPKRQALLRRLTAHRGSGTMKDGLVPGAGRAAALFFRLDGLSPKGYRAVMAHDPFPLSLPGRGGYSAGWNKPSF